MGDVLTEAAVETAVRDARGRGAAQQIDLQQLGQQFEQEMQAKLKVFLETHVPGQGHAQQPPAQQQMQAPAPLQGPLLHWLPPQVSRAWQG